MSTHTLHTVFPNYLALTQVGLASAFRDRATSPVLQKLPCCRCEVPFNTSYSSWQSNYEDWMKLRLSQITMQVSHEASRTRTAPTAACQLTLVDLPWSTMRHGNLCGNIILSRHKWGEFRPCCRFPGVLCKAGANGTGPCTNQWVSSGFTNYYWASFVSPFPS